MVDEKKGSRVEEDDVERQAEEARKLETVSEWPGEARSPESVDLE